MTVLWVILAIIFGPMILKCLFCMGFAILSMPYALIFQYQNKKKN
jgi:hypothetical protein